MEPRREREWDLTIGPDTVRDFILKAKAISAAVNEDYEDGHEHEVEIDANVRDTHHHDGLAEEEAADSRAVELRDLLRDLNIDEIAELVALVWIGRGDYDAAEWGEAVEEARRRYGRRATSFLMGLPLLGDYLEEGLEALGA
ncbi:MAG: DUF3775 domain-containing protein [Rhizobiaceae bacterium]